MDGHSRLLNEILDDVVQQLLTELRIRRLRCQQDFKPNPDSVRTHVESIRWALKRAEWTALLTTRKPDNSSVLDRATAFLTLTKQFDFAIRESLRAEVLPEEWIKQVAPRLLSRCCDELIGPTSDTRSEIEPG
jgi:hypothetical protein